MKILVLGANGMLGHVVVRRLAEDPLYEVVGTVRGDATRSHVATPGETRIIGDIDAERPDALVMAFTEARPEVVINCIGLVKQLADAQDPLRAIPINAVLPHRLAGLCRAIKARLVHISTDCVFTGNKGHYVETDAPDARDLYGRSKLLGEVDYPHAITLRTSIIGPELTGNHGLLGWFLSQAGGPVPGYRRAVFSGLPTVELAGVIREYVLPRADLHGLYHVASSAISKFELLGLIATAYARDVEVLPEDEPVIDRSLDGRRFEYATGYAAPSWPELVRRMREFG